MDEAENSPTVEARSVKRARPDDSDAPHANGSSHRVEATMPASKQPAMHTKALRSVLKGACAHVYAQAFYLLLAVNCSNWFKHLTSFIMVCSVRCQDG